jgi:hypothetical protein
VATIPFSDLPEEVLDLSDPQGFEPPEIAVRYEPTALPRRREDQDPSVA